MAIFTTSKSNFVIVSMCLTACAPPPVAPRPDPASAETVRICDDHGCVDRPKGYVSPAMAAGPADVDGGKIAALEAHAAKDPRAAYDLALRFFRGDGVRQDSYRSLTWMRDAAERGELHAQKALGRLYLTGMGEMGPGGK
jgi:uncharacterized protein